MPGQQIPGLPRTYCAGTTAFGLVKEHMRTIEAHLGELPYFKPMLGQVFTSSVSDVAGARFSQVPDKHVRCPN